MPSQLNSIAPLGMTITLLFSVFAAGGDASIELGDIGSAKAAVYGSKKNLYSSSELTCSRLLSSFLEKDRFYGGTLLF